MGMGFAPTWLRQVSPPASQNHFNHCILPRAKITHETSYFHMEWILGLLKIIFDRGQYDATTVQ